VPVDTLPEYTDDRADLRTRRTGRGAAAGSLGGTQHLRAGGGTVPFKR